jgi:hypothetical protein
VDFQVVVVLSFHTPLLSFALSLFPGLLPRAHLDVYVYKGTRSTNSKYYLVVVSEITDFASDDHNIPSGLTANRSSVRLHNPYAIGVGCKPATLWN